MDDQKRKRYWATVRDSMTPEEWREFHKKWSDEHRESVRRNSRAYYATHSETILANREVFNERATTLTQQRRAHWNKTPHPFRLMTTKKGPRCTDCYLIESNHIHIKEG